MCGITGFFHFHAKRTSGVTLQRMTSCLKHRGPNDSGCILFNFEQGMTPVFFHDSVSIQHPIVGSVGLGHRRLSILDLSECGRQPMSTSDGAFWIVFNGEIYNYLELRNELELLGHAFHTGTDTEVVLIAFQTWGTRCFSKFNGMWAIAIFNTQTQVLTLSRDRFGKKPLYYHVSRETFVFASEIKSLFQHQDVPRDVNFSKVVDYAGRHYRYVDDNHDTYYQEIYHIPKSSYLLVFPNGKMKFERYWHLEIPADPKVVSDLEAREIFHYLLTDAVKIRLRSDVPVGCMLSGGLDSGSITCIAANMNHDMHTFSGVTGEGYFDESEYIQEIVRHTGMKHTFIYPDVFDVFPILEEMLKFYDEPVCTVTWLANFVITKHIQENGVPVILTGHGGDELLAGYWDHYHHLFWDMRANSTDDMPEKLAWLKQHKRDHSEYDRESTYLAAVHHHAETELEKYSRYLSVLKPEILAFSQKKVLQGPPMCGSLNRRLYLELLHETVPPSLRAEDRNMMRFSIENRLPFLDYRLVEFCFSLPNKMKIRNGLSKWLLRESMKDTMPHKVCFRKDKTGFNAPFDLWLRTGLRSMVENLMHDDSTANQLIYDMVKVRGLYEEHLAGKNHYMFFWQYLNLSLWFKQLENEAV